jgi:hypothetical protein
LSPSCSSYLTFPRLDQGHRRITLASSELVGHLGGRDQLDRHTSKGQSIGAHRSWDGSVAVPDGEDSIVPGDEIMPDVLPSASADVPGMPESLIFQSKMPQTGRSW